MSYSAWIAQTVRKEFIIQVFRKTRQHDQRQIDRAVRAQKLCERDHQGPAAETYERQVRWRATTPAGSARRSSLRIRSGSPSVRP